MTGQYTLRDYAARAPTGKQLLKDAYRNHSEHARDNPYDMDKARSILNHVRDFMQPLEKGGLRVRPETSALITEFSEHEAD
jgi:hypothetical protein